ncbi:helix-turn-helix domain-containing protein [Salinibaculum rarum]|uniref:helix-turn-helix domain-containing protein n=1 Tax=Salinibaculum rarum TaxID=3058903 RepID=UPI00265EC285|nr:helix-turn-helix domain-containing protein [Salinibaculum sp. KK48]
MIDESLVVEFTVTGNDCPVVEATADNDVVVDENPPAHRDDDRTLLHFHAEGEVDEFVDQLDEEDEIDYLQVTEGGSVAQCRCLLHDECVLRVLTTAGFMPHEIRIVDGTERFRGSVVGRDVLRDVIQTAQQLGNVKLERVAEITAGRAADQELDTTIESSLTKQQREALVAALDQGYFDVPRGATATDVADQLGISKSSFLGRIKRAQQTVFEQLLAGAG